MDKVLIKVDLGEIKPYKNNPRKNDKAVKDVKESIRQCGYCNPIIVDEDMIVLAGHTRLRAMQELGIEKCDVMIVSGLTEEQKKKYRIYDNKTSEFAEWDDWLLRSEIEDLDFSDFEFDFGLKELKTEFSNKEYGEDTFTDEQFKYVCPCCGFRFNK